MCRFWKNIKNEIYLSLFGQSMKNIIIVNVGYFCMGQKMMWDNLVNLSLILYQQIVNYIARWKNINLHTIMH
jgi:hypothetical protein